MPPEKHILIVLGTAREGRESEKVARFILEETKKTGAESEIIDVRDYRINATDKTKKSPQAKKLSLKVTESDALIIISPEYNHTYPGELKMMIDMIYEEYSKKPVGLCGVSSGVFGGARVVEQLRLLTSSLGMFPIKEALYFPFVQKLFDENNAIKEESFRERTRIFLNELISCTEEVKKSK